MLTKTNKNKKPKAPVKELLDLSEKIVVESVFKLKEIKMKDDFIWRMKVELLTRLSQSFREYDVKLSANEKPFLTKIEDLNRRKADIESENQLFEGNKKAQIKEIENEITECEEELEEMKRMCQVIEFKGTIEELKYKDGNTIVVMMFPSEVLAELDSNKTMFRNYKVELIRG